MPRRGARKSFCKARTHPALAGGHILHVCGEVVVVNRQHARRGQHFLALGKKAILIKPVQRRSGRDQIEFSRSEIELLGKPELIA